MEGTSKVLVSLIEEGRNVGHCVEVLQASGEIGAATEPQVLRVIVGQLRQMENEEASARSIVNLVASMAVSEAPASGSEFSPFVIDVSALARTLLSMGIMDVLEGCYREPQWLFTIVRLAAEPAFAEAVANSSLARWVIEQVCSREHQIAEAALATLDHLKDELRWEDRRLLCSALAELREDEVSKDVVAWFWQLVVVLLGHVIETGRDMVGEQTLLQTARHLESSVTHPIVPRAAIKVLWHCESRFESIAFAATPLGRWLEVDFAIAAREAQEEARMKGKQRKRKADPGRSETLLWALLLAARAGTPRVTSFLLKAIPRLPDPRPIRRLCAILLEIVPGNPPTLRPTGAPVPPLVDLLSP